MARSASHARSWTTESELTAIIESAQESIIGLTPQGIIRSWNPAAARLYGYASPEIVGQPAQILFPARLDQKETEFLRRIGGGERVSLNHVERRRKDGTAIAVSVTGSPVTDADGTVVGITTVSSSDPVPPPREVTETEHGQTSSQQAQRLENLGQLAGGVAHDFNNLLAVILNYVAFVRQELADASDSDWPARLETASSDLAQVTRAADRASSLTRQLLAFARRDVIRPQALDLDTVVTSVEEMLRRTLGEHIELVTSLAGDLWPILADPGQLEQVLVNLAVNARDAMPAGGTLTIDTSNSTVDADSIAGGSQSPEGGNVRLRVSDTGVGMSREVIDHVFEPFFTTKNEGAGTGLGLATVYGILAQNEGHIKIYSEPGTGTTFSIMLPATAEAARPLSKPAAYHRTPKGETVLVVEDEEALLQVTKRILIRNGYQVLTAADGQEAIRIASDHPGGIHLLITDVVMPHMLGRDVAEKVRAVSPEIEVLFMSGYAQPVLTSQGRLDPNMALVEKPFSEADLLAKAGQVLNGKFRGFKTVKGDGA
jgi:PAS domain S-box-containing protein